MDVPSFTVNVRRINVCAGSFESLESTVMHAQSTVPAVPSPSCTVHIVPVTLAFALEAHRASRFHEAESLYREALDVCPKIGRAHV